MPIFIAGSEPGLWVPTALAAGPFAGLQGGAVAGLLVGEIEALAQARGWGEAVSASAWFLKPVPMAPLRSETTVLRTGGRVSMVDGTLWPAGEEEPCATVRVTLVRDRPIELPPVASVPWSVVDPSIYPVVGRRAPHGGPWFMDAMEARPGGDTAWFRLKDSIVEGAGPLSRALGPADWAHGIARPLQNVAADPNPNLTVHLVRRPRGDWIGVRAWARWQPERGIGMGGGALLDTDGEIGSVSMAVALTPFPAPAAMRASA
jgi:hypothetical protein